VIVAAGDRPVNELKTTSTVGVARTVFTPFAVF
jgi:hypothetical protein